MKILDYEVLICLPSELEWIIKVALLVEQIVDFFIVELEVGAFDLGMGIHILIDHFHRLLDDAGLFFVALHTECFACSCLAIGHDGYIEALQELGDELVDMQAVEGGLFGGIGIMDGIDLELLKFLVVVEGEATYDLDGNIISDNRVYAPNSKAVNYISWAKDIYQKEEAGEDFYFDETFFKIREIILTYQVPSKVLQNNFINAASISFVGRNMFLFTDVPQIDPDQGFDDQFQSPSTRSFGFNLNLKF